MPRITLIQRFSLLCLIALVLFGIGFGWISGFITERDMLTRSKQITANIVSENVKKHFKSDDLITPKTGASYKDFSEKITLISIGPNIERIKIWNKDKYVVWADDSRLVGKRFPENRDLDIAIGGQIVSEISLTKKDEHELERQFIRLHELYVPIRFEPNLDIETVFEIYQNLDPLYIDIYQQKKIIWIATILGFTFLYLILFAIMSRASKRIEAQTREIAQSEERYRTLVQSAQDGIISIDRTGKVILVNEATAQMFGYSTGELMGQPVTVIIPEKYRQKHQNGMSRLLQTDETTLVGKSVELEGLRKDGQVFPIDLSISISEGTNTPIVTAILRDISERKAMQEQIINAEKQASVSIIAGSIGHELNNAVSGLMGYADLLKMKPGDIKMGRKCAEIFATQSQRLKLHASNLLSLSKPPEPEMKPIDINSFLEKTTDMLYVSGLLKRYTIVKEFSKNLSQILGDEALLEQLIRNLEINAAHAMGNEGILTLRTRFSEKKSHVEFSIADTGHGIPDDRRNQIFLPFYTTKDKGKGTGLGMYIVKQTVEKHKGYIRLESEVGVGTRMTIGLPVKESSH